MTQSDSYPEMTETLILMSLVEVGCDGRGGSILLGTGSSKVCDDTGYISLSASNILHHDLISSCSTERDLGWLVADLWTIPTGARHQHRPSTRHRASKGVFLYFPIAADQRETWSGGKSQTFGSSHECKASTSTSHQTARIKLCLALVLNRMGRACEDGVLPM